MKLKRTKKGSRNLKQFYKVHWPLSDKEHFGRVVEWKPVKFILEAYDGSDGIVGALEGKVEAGVCYLSTLIVHYKRHGQGIGSRLIAEAEKIARTHNAHKIFLSTGKGWASEKFYKKLGYKQTATLAKHYAGHDFVIFTKYF